MHTKLAQPRANKSLLSQSQLHAVNFDTYTPQYPLCLHTHTHMTPIIFLTVVNATSLQKKPLEVAEVLE